MHYAVQQFAGPLEILIKLVKSRELPIDEIELLRLCHQLVQALEDPLPGLNPGLSASLGAEHTLLFAQLAESKLDLLSATENPICQESEGPLELWIEQIELYARMKLAAQLLWSRQASTARRYARRPSPPVNRLRPLTWQQLQTQLNRLVRAALPGPQAFQASLIDSGPSLQECIQFIWQQMEKEGPIPLANLFVGQSLERCIGHFLAVLELFKMHKIQVIAEDDPQNEGTLWIQRTT